MSHLWRTPHALEGRRLAARVGPGARALDRPLADALRQALIDLGHRPHPLAAPASALRG
jgi:hypothetical protein